MQVEGCKSFVRSQSLKSAVFAFLVFFSAPTLSAQNLGTSAFNPSNDSLTAIYGPDNRHEAWEVEHLPFVAEFARATGMFVRRSDVAKLPPSDPAEPAKCKIIGRTLENRYGLCPDERFAKQPSPGYCSGVLVASDILVTAGHCMRSATDCQNTAIIFDFQMASSDKWTREPTVPATAVYVCSSIIERSQDHLSGIDFAVIRLNRRADDRAPVKMRTEGEISYGANLTTLGYQSGLPLKVSLSGQVRSLNKNGYFTATLDTTDGSSGSPVFDADTGILEGIVVRGQSAYLYNGTCYQTKICNQSDCRGEDVTRANIIAKSVPGTHSN